MTRQERLVKGAMAGASSHLLLLADLATSRDVCMLLQQPLLLRGLASLVNSFVAHLTGDQRRELHVSNMAALGFDPDGLLVQVMLSLLLRIQTNHGHLLLYLAFVPCSTGTVSLHTLSTTCLTQCFDLPFAVTLFLAYRSPALPQKPFHPSRLSVGWLVPVEPQVANLVGALMEQPAMKEPLVEALRANIDCNPDRFAEAARNLHKRCAVP